MILPTLALRFQPRFRPLVSDCSRVFEYAKIRTVLQSNTETALLRRGKWKISENSHKDMMPLVSILNEFACKTFMTKSKSLCRVANCSHGKPARAGILAIFLATLSPPHSMSTVTENVVNANFQKVKEWKAIATSKRAASYHFILHPRATCCVTHGKSSPMGNSLRSNTGYASLALTAVNTSCF